MNAQPPNVLRASVAVLAALSGFCCSSTAQVAPAAPPAGSRPSAEQALANLRDAWTEALTTAAKTAASPQAAPRLAAAPLTAEAEAALPEPQRPSLAAAATVSFQEPEAFISEGRELRATLVGIKALNRIGNDQVYLRSYNGNLTGPTLRAKPGDTLRITVRNDFAPEGGHAGQMNTLHAFNTMNLHTHGLNVSPKGVGDNVLLEIAPRSSQDIEIVIPADHPAGTFWYHTHKHGSTAAQVSSGMAGALIIDGGMDNVPEIKAAKERILVFQQIAYYIPPGQTVGIIEPEYADKSLAPRTWDTLGRFTTINGIKLPVFRVQPGAVERWRMIHAGIRESISVKFERAPGVMLSQTAPITMHEIAADGLSLGKAVPTQLVELWPGYRSDVLVQFPEQPGEYLIIDESPRTDATINGVAESRKYLARVIVEGKLNKMTLPKDSQLAQYRLKSITPEEVTKDKDGKPKTQKAVYSLILEKNKPTKFWLDEQSFSMNRARTLTLGEVEEWVIRGENSSDGVPLATVSHPHHIHVNPFEVYSMVDATGKETLKEPIWRDTVIIHNGWTVKARTRYEKFDGMFVQHCHILDHEDQGMMELVDIKHPEGTKGKMSYSDGANPSLRVKNPFSAPAWELTDAAGAQRKLTEFKGKPTVLFFFKGHGCLHCTEQVALFGEQFQEFQKLGANVIGITTDDAATLAEAVKNAPTPLTLVSDAANKSFRDYGCFAGEALHGTFVLDANGAVQWQTVGTSPFMAIDNVLAEVARLKEAAAAPAKPKSLAVR